MVPAIEEALKAGITVVVTTSAEEGKVHPTYSYSGSAEDLQQKGVLLGGDYDSKKARIKLGVYYQVKDSLIREILKSSKFGRACSIAALHVTI